MAAEVWSDNVYVVHLADEPAFSEELDQLERQLTDGPRRHVVLDFDGVSFVNSSNLSQLIRLRRLVGENKCQLLLAAVRPEVWSTFLVSGLDKVFVHIQSVPLALAGLQLSEAEAGQ